MFAYTLALAQGGPRLDGSAVNVMVMALVAGAVGLVFWASRPSVIARYPAAPRPEEDRPAEPVAPEDHA
jgi:hypothetical protein